MSVERRREFEKAPLTNAGDPRRKLARISES